jgi:hypothetical protein
VRSRRRRSREFQILLRNRLPEAPVEIQRSAHGVLLAGRHCTVIRTQGVFMDMREEDAQAAAEFGW